MKKILFAITLTLSVLSCRESQRQNPPIIENAIDNAESSVSGSFKSYRDDNLIDKTYSELIKNNKTLKALDDKILKTQKESAELLKTYDEILGKSDAFYKEAGYSAKSITDSLIKQQIEKEIQTGADQYSVKTRNIISLIAQINKNNVNLNNLYTAFKIRKALSEIEKYQNAHPLKADSLDAFINKQNKLLEELKNIK
ncbi:Uncharacterised protein [Chryseobacterium nakagawai]|uniref:Lipoprotein n=1 Tax=Chryseobacterium nakagawai TaxID=1241982 RepID=A0AAD1DPL7_CHRNA|nr:hypothetical protein [Chryseobacterium nakagawai]AZA89510.1 hypothetical protein EG343_02130 [Chryseobacterium nakagawai]VEH20879.1 Uncharacterised protein [Chryseobacterium nakagawai]